MLRDAIDRLKSSGGDLPNQAEVATLLVEAKDALEHAKVVAGAIAECERFVNEAKFDQAFEVLDAAMAVYPADPALVTRRSETEQQQRTFHTAAAVRSAIDETDFLLNQNRVDLAVQFLKAKVAELPGQPQLVVRLDEVESLIPQWEQKRHIHAALERAATLEQLQQWQAALTVVEVALQSYSTSEDLIAAARRVQARLLADERAKKLARRVEQIRHKIAAQSWRPAIRLLEDTRQEFPNTPDLVALDREAREGLRRSECEAAIAEVRQCLSDCEVAKAEEILRKAFVSLGADPSLEALREELESQREYLVTLQAAQVHFGQRQLDEAERLLAQLVAPNRPEVQALLDAVRQARAATEEEDFCERGREKALELIRQRQFAQAADLLRNLLALFPGNQILERELKVAQDAMQDAAREILPPREEKECSPRPGAATVSPAPASSGPAREPAPSRFRRVAIAGTASLVLVSASGAVWEFSRTAPPAAKPVAAPIAPPAVAGPPPAAQNAAAPGAVPPAEAPESQSQAPTRDAPVQRAASGTTSHEGSRALAVRQFVPVETKKAAAGNQDLPLPPPPTAAAVVSSPSITTGSEVVRLLNTPGPPPTAPPSPAVSAPPPQAKQALPAGGRLKEAQLVQSTLPEYPELARGLRVTGIVRISALIDEQGAVKNVTILSGQPLLAAAAKSAVLKWRYIPATLNDKPIATNVQIQLSFGERNR